MRAKELIRLIEKDGWFLKRVNGSHHIYKHPVKPGVAVIAQHGSKDIPEGTVKGILKQAGLE